MFKLHKHRSAKSSDRIEFRISHLKALQVPKGWDKLFVSVVSVENGKTIAKSSKVTVRNGSCQWSDVFAESIWFSRDNLSKETDDCILKLIVAMGSLRSGILGEATVSMTSYASSDAAVPLSIPLNKCNHGTVLNVTVQCLTPRKKPRDQESRETNSHLKAMSENNHEVTVKSNGSDQSVESSSVGDVDSTLSSPEEVETMAESLPGSVSNYSYNSAEDSTGKGNFSTYMSDGQSRTGRQDSTGSQKSVSHYDYPVNNNSSQSNRSSFNSQNMQDTGASSYKKTNGSNNSLEATEDTSEELRAEAKMWEMNARKLLGDLEMLRTGFSDQSKKMEGLEMDLSTAYVERDNLKKEVEQLTLSSGDPIVRQKTLEDSISQGESIPEIENALKDELKFQKESNANLSLQLKKSQEANVELVSVLQELEETIEQQKLEIENLSSLPSKLSALEKSFQVSEEGNMILIQQIEQLEESKKNLLAMVQKLEEASENKIHDIEHAKIPNKKTLQDIEIEYEIELSAKEEEISSLKARLLDSVPETCNGGETVSRNVGDADLLEQIEVLNEKVQELEMDCNELTNENLELLFKLKEAKTDSKDGGASKDLLSNIFKDQSFSSSESVASNNLFRIFHSEDMLPEENTKKISNDGHISIRELETSKSAQEVRITDLNNELTDETSEMENLEVELENAKNQSARLQEKIAEMQSEMDSSIEDLEQKLKETQFHWSEAQEECEYLRGENQQLQITIENLEEECDSFEKLNGYLRQQKLELEEYCSLMGARLRESSERFDDYCERVGLLEKKFALMLEEITSKEKNLTSEMDGILDENRKHMDQGQSLLNQMQMEKIVEIQNLKLEIENLSLKLSAAYDEKERIASNALLEVSTLRAGKAKLEFAFGEVQSEVILSKNEVNVMQTEYKQKLKDLTTELADFKFKMETLMAEHEKLSELVEDYKSRELKLKSTINSLESKLTDTEYERQQYMDESRNSKVQLQQTCQFENEIMALKSELNTSNTEKERLKASLCLKSELCEDLKAENTSFERKMSSLEKAASELEHCKRTRTSLEERLMQLENDLNARDARCAQEKSKLQEKAQALEEELKLIKEQKRNQVSKLNRKPVNDDQKASKNSIIKNTNQVRSNRKKPSLKNDREILKDQQDPYNSRKHQTEVESEHGLLDENVHVVEVEPVSKTQLLETAVEKAKEAIDIYEVQLNRSSSQGRNNHANGPVKSIVEEEQVTKEKFERTKSILEEELRDIQDRYFHMSLKYAEVESQREELVMKLRVAKSKKGWLS
ncbi:putative transcription factor bZIP family [Medicago truncatula]|uniref:Myosin heavy chain-like protein, putative n=1 Tax=Medicago truncatula TaxID=3880 RepID=G7IA77_MEDTR|nr:nucleoprotein TPR isoform X2 [Medicago truncatula]AES60694.2 myosin heavy chain-like protein, putative [Medicago truncatula]RHN79669.1 putative transcription factor bZIP family [Medicago truncatula]